MPKTKKTLAGGNRLSKAYIQIFYFIPIQYTPESDVGSDVHLFPM